MTKSKHKDTNQRLRKVKYSISLKTKFDPNQESIQGSIRLITIETTLNTLKFKIITLEGYRECNQDNNGLKVYH